MAHYDEQAFGVTLDLQMKYRKPVPLGVELKAIGRITRDSGRIFFGSGELYLPDGRIAVTAEGKYMKRHLEQITSSDFMEEEWFAPGEDLPDELSL